MPRPDPGYLWLCDGLQGQATTPRCDCACRRIGSKEEEDSISLIYISGRRMMGMY